MNLPDERKPTLNKRKLLAVAGATAALAAFAAPAQADDAAQAVCNEAEASWQGGYTVTGSQDPNPPARLYGGPGQAMAVGNGQLNSGLVNAAGQSPALALCGAGDGGPTGTDGGGDGSGDTGGGDGGGIIS
jgi:hypothetical protein